MISREGFLRTVTSFRDVEESNFLEQLWDDFKARSFKNAIVEVFRLHSWILGEIRLCLYKCFSVIYENDEFYGEKKINGNTYMQNYENYPL